MKTNEIRSKFLNYFKKRDHKVVSSDSLIPTSDPTLLFTSAGMVQFKKHFLGLASTPLQRAASCQKCLRTSDIERVGLTSRHLTFFEMLGNFSFGDYFKKEAIPWGWEFLTKECGLNESNLYATIYKEDEEAFQIWKKILPEGKIVRLGEDSNFWNMGETGPCGPCSEILYDRGEHLSQDHKCPGPGCDCDRYLEVWNLVFTQFDRLADKSLKPLPQKNIDTGMGLERLDLVINGLESAFETDAFQALSKQICKSLGQTPRVTSLRIVADHIRAATFLISDGILPSNEGRGYVLRRLLRRALRQGWIHGHKQPFLCDLVPTIVKEMGSAYPELEERAKSIESIIETEERNSLESIEVGTRALEEEVKKATGNLKLHALGAVSLDGEKVFSIYDTYGLSPEIQREIIRDWGGELSFLEEDYNKAKKAAIHTARKGWKGSGEKDVTVYTHFKKKIGSSLFRGYETLETESKVTGILKVKHEVLELKEGEEGEVFLSETPFYAESGGQVGDEGTLESLAGEQNLVTVNDTQRPIDGFTIHKVKVMKGTLKVGQTIRAKVNASFRKATMRHHTATHLLHASLRKILGTQVTQAGSLVSPQKLRFDFTTPKALSLEQLQKIEQEVNQNILDNIPRKRSEGSLEQARSLGALAFFGEKYGDKVYVVNYGQASTEVCGGTHCFSTGEIGLFKIISESSVGSNVRRIEALAGEAALSYLKTQEEMLQNLTNKLKCSLQEIPEKCDKLLQRNEILEQELNHLKHKDESAKWTSLIGKAKTLPKKLGETSLQILAEQVEPMDPKRMREAADHLREKLIFGIVLLASQQEEKVSFVVSVTANCVKESISASALAKQFAKLIGGSAGGKDIFAQGGGKSASNLEKVLEDFIRGLHL